MTVAWPEDPDIGFSHSPLCMLATLRLPAVLRLPSTSWTANLSAIRLHDTRGSRHWFQCLSILCISALTRNLQLSSPSYNVFPHHGSLFSMLLGCTSWHAVPNIGSSLQVRPFAFQQLNHNSTLTFQVTSSTPRLASSANSGVLNFQNLDKFSTPSKYSKFSNV